VIDVFHGTSHSNYEKILEKGLTLGNSFTHGKKHGDAIYATTRKHWAEKFGPNLIEFSVDTDDFFYIEDDDYAKLYDSFTNEFVQPYETISAYIYNKQFAEIHNLSEGDNRKNIKSFIRETEFQIGSLLQERLTSKGYKGIVIASKDSKGPFCDLTIYDLSCISM
jgi:hypothetical protein